MYVVTLGINTVYLIIESIGITSCQH